MDVWILKGLQPGTRVAIRKDKVVGLVEQGEYEPGQTRVVCETEEYVVDVPFDEALRGWMGTTR